MSTNFLQGLGLDRDIFRRDSLILSHQVGHVDGSFILQFLISEFGHFGMEEGESKILLILNRQSTTHWMSVSSKLGSNIQRFKQIGQLRILDLLQATYEFLVNSDKVSSALENNLLDGTSGHLSLACLLSKCITEVDKLYPPAESSHSEGGGTKKKLLILLEDFSSLIQWSGASEKCGLNFLRSLRFLRPDLEVSLVTLVCSREEDSSGVYFSSLLSQVLSTTTFHVNQLRTGFSSEVHGVLRVQEQGKRLSPSYHYKLLDRGIQFIPL